MMGQRFIKVGKDSRTQSLLRPILLLQGCKSFDRLGIDDDDSCLSLKFD